jgi:PPM family protein phosphatase
MNLMPLIESFGISDIGVSRTNNEDVWAELPDDHFYVLADGMGGHQAGEIAAKEAVLHLCDSMERLFRNHPHPTVELAKKHLRQAFIESNAWIRSLAAKHPDFHGMGTTLCAILILGKELLYAHVGDSRIYRFRGKLERMTNDHSLRQDMLTRGELNEKTAVDFPYKNVLTRALGISPQLEPEVQSTTLLPGDVYFLSSDGLHDPLTDKQIETVFRQSGSIKEAAIELVEAAKNSGGQDNITILILKNNA